MARCPMEKDPIHFREEFLKDTTSEERVEAAIWFYADEKDPTSTSEREYFIRLGARLVGEEGWQEVAPAWIRAIRERSTK